MLLIACVQVSALKTMRWCHNHSAISQFFHLHFPTRHFLSQNSPTGFFSPWIHVIFICPLTRGAVFLSSKLMCRCGRDCLIASSVCCASGWLISPLTPLQRPGGRRGRRHSPGRRRRRRRTRCWWRGRWGGSVVGQCDLPARPIRRPQPSSPGTRSDLRERKCQGSARGRDNEGETRRKQ